ncbi:helix-turn-helix domain-containing protein [Chryseobacterium sp. T1]
MSKVDPLNSKIDKTEATQQLLLELLRTAKQKEEKYYDNADMKRLFHVSDTTLYRMRRNGSIPFIKFGRKLFYPVSFFKYKAPE